MRHGERFLYSYALRTSIIDSDDNCRSHSCCAPPSTVGQVDCGGRWSGESVPYSEEVRPEGFAFKTRLPFAVGTSREPICELATDTPDSSQALLLLLSTDTSVEECGAHWRRRPLNSRCLSTVNTTVVLIIPYEKHTSWRRRGEAFRGGAATSSVCLFFTEAFCGIQSSLASSTTKRFGT